MGDITELAALKEQMTAKAEQAEKAPKAKAAEDKAEEAPAEA